MNFTLENNLSYQAKVLYKISVVNVSSKLYVFIFLLRKKKKYYLNWLRATKALLASRMLPVGQGLPICDIFSFHRCCILLLFPQVSFLLSDEGVR